MIVDIVIVLLLISAVFRGREIGFVQQLLSTVGFFGGLLLGAWLQKQTVQLVHGVTARSLMTIATTLGMALLFLALGELLGHWLKRRLHLKLLIRIDGWLGSLLSIMSILLAVWLSAGIVKSLPLDGLQKQFASSKIATTLSNHLPYAPNIVAGIGQLIDPNGFPQVFIGNEPNLPTHINIPSSSLLLAAVHKDRQSVVKMQGQGCGGVVDGSGFVVGDNLVATNAHVVAGITHEYASDANGAHTATPIWFDPDLDLAILRVSNLAGEPLALASRTVSNNTAAAVLGYPGGGGFTANPASVLDHFTATGRNIYQRSLTSRSIYEVAGNIEPGNSGGPLVSADGTVVGVVFARSTSYSNAGYALTTPAVVQAIRQAAARNQVVNTGSCTP